MRLMRLICKIYIGKHDVTIVYDDGETGTVLTIKEQVSVNTGDESKAMIWIMLMLGAMLSGCAVMCDRKKKRA